MQHDGLRPVDVAKRAAPGTGPGTRERSMTAHTASGPKGMPKAAEKYHRLSAGGSERPDLAVQADNQGADLVLGGSCAMATRRWSTRWGTTARRGCSSCCSTWGSRKSRSDFPSASQTDFDFARWCIEEGNVPEDVSLAGAGAVPARADHPHVRGSRGCEQADCAFLQFDVGAATPGGVPARMWRESGRSRWMPPR
jgi:hypothetical protein